MRSHPFAGVVFILAGLGLFVKGAIGGPMPAIFGRAPVPASLLVTFVLWQLAVWSILFGVFFLRPRGRQRTHRGAIARVMTRF